MRSLRWLRWSCGGGRNIPELTTLIREFGYSLYSFAELPVSESLSLHEKYYVRFMIRGIHRRFVPHFTKCSPITSFTAEHCRFLNFYSKIRKIIAICFSWLYIPARNTR